MSGMMHYDSFSGRLPADDIRQPRNDYCLARKNVKPAKKWSARRSAAFIVISSLVLWVVIASAVFLIVSSID